VLNDFVEHIDTQNDQQASATDKDIEGCSPYADGDQNNCNKESPTRGNRNPGCFEGELEHMKDLLPDRRARPSLYAGNEFPVDSQEEQAKERGKDKFCDHFSTR